MKSPSPSPTLSVQIPRVETGGQSLGFRIAGLKGVYWKVLESLINPPEESSELN